MSVASDDWKWVLLQGLIILLISFSLMYVHHYASCMYTIMLSASKPHIFDCRDWHEAAQSNDDFSSPPLFVLQAQLGHNSFLPQKV